MKRLSIFLVLITFIPACTFRSLALRNIDWLVERRLNDIFDLNDAQEAQLEPTIKDFMGFLKGPLGQQAMGTIDSIIQHSQNGLSEDEISTAFDKILKMRRAIMERYASELATLFKSLSDQQLQHYKKQQAADDEDLIAVLTSKNFNDAAKEALESRIDLLSAWYGDLNHQQKELLYSSSSTKQEHFRERLNYRQKSREFFMTMVKKPQSEIHSFLNQWAVNPSLRAQQLGFDSMAQWRERLIPFLVKFHASLTPKQWQTFREELGSLRRDIASFVKS